MNRLSTKIIASALSALMILSPVTALAANSKDYIKEVYISTAKNENTAKDYLTKNGYTILDNNLNEGTGQKCVYLGYKTTKNPNEAITDLKVMDMNGGYSQTSYDKIIDKEKKGITKNTDALQKVIKLYKENYKNKAPLALYAHDSLNKFIDEKTDSSKKLKCDEGKTNMLMGDYFLNDSINSSNLTTLLLQSNSNVIESIYQNLALGIYAENEESVLEKFAKVDIDGEFSSKLDEKAKIIVDLWDIMYDGLKAYDESEVKFSDGDEKVKQYINTLDDAKKLDYVKYGTIYEIIKNIEFGSESMLDYFMQENIRAKDVYPLASVISDEQAIVLPHIGLAELLTLSGSKDILNESKEIIDNLENGESDKETKPTSVYINVDQNLFGGNVALTSQALAYQNASGDSPWYKANVNFYISLGIYITTGLAIGVAAVSGIMYLVKNARITGSLQPFKDTLDASTSACSALRQAAENSRSAYYLAASLRNTPEAMDMEQMNGILDTFNARLEAFKDAKTVMDKDLLAYQAAKDSAESAASLGWIFTAATGVALLAQGVYYGIKLYNYYHPDYLQIPQIICDERNMLDEQKEINSTYIYYYAALQHIDGDTKNEYGEYADLNGFTGKQWNALYTTTDSKAGNPIVAKSLSVKLGDNTTQDNEIPLSLFQNSSSYNINSHQYSDKKNGIYITFKTDKITNSTASVFTSGNVALIAGLSAAVGIVIGTACVIITNKKSKKSNQITTNN